MQLRWNNNEWRMDSGGLINSSLINRRVCQLVSLSDSTVELCSNDITISFSRDSFFPLLTALLAGMPIPKIECDIYIDSFVMPKLEGKLMSDIFMKDIYYLGYAFYTVMLYQDQLQKLHEVVAQSV